ncbi:MAG: hypothetical protein ACW98X_25590 [Promethearchaeota archaeon]|jgi:hypothetical protein
MKKVNEMSIEEIREVLDEKVDWDKIHRETVFQDWGMSLSIYSDGDYGLLGSQTSLQDYSCVIGELKCTGWGNTDQNYYLDGWGEWDQWEGDFITDDGRKLTEREAFIECIRDGDHQKLYDEWKESLIEQVQEAKEHAELTKLRQQAHEEYLESLKNEDI